MTTQQKINRIEKSGKKVRFDFSGKIVIGNHSFGSINAAHKYFFGY